MAKLTPGEVRILELLEKEPQGTMPVNALPTDIDFRAYRELRDRRRISESKGRSGFLIATITKLGRAALSENQ